MFARRHPHFTLLAMSMVLVVWVVAFLAAPKAAGETQRAFRGELFALTFDDGPDPRFTPAVLDALKASGHRATFFVVGEHAERYPELVERMVAEGHEVAHHTHSHPYVDRLTDAELAAEMDCCLDILSAQGISPVWYRPPHACLTDAQVELAAAREMRVAMWARCFERVRFTSAEEMAEVLAAETRRGEIVLAHDGLLDRSMTVDALPRYLRAIDERGLRSVTLSELFADL